MTDPKIESKHQQAESALTAAFLEIIAKGEGTEFTADTLYHRVSQKLPLEKLKGILQRKAGLIFRKMKALHLVHQTPRAVKSERNDGALLQIWKVGRATKVEPLIAEIRTGHSDFSARDDF